MPTPTVIGPASPESPATTWHTRRDPGRRVVWVHRVPELTPEPGDWADRLAEPIGRVHGVAAVGAKRLGADGKVFAMGEFVVHPKGFHHHGKAAQAYRFPEEADALSGGVFAVSAEAFDAVDGEAALAGELGGIELGLRLRHRGLRCLAVPQAVVVDGHSPAPTDEEAAAFAERWGFGWAAADLDAVQQRYAGTGLLWHPRFHSPAMPFDKYESRPAMHWDSYHQHDGYRQRADFLAKVVAEQCPADATALDFGCGDGLFTHLAAQRGVTAVGVDIEQLGIEQATTHSNKQTYPGTAPRFVHTQPGPLPFADGAFGLVYLFDVIEHLPNPVAVLRELGRVLAPGGTLLITTPQWQFGGSSDPTYHVTEYTPEELARQVNAVGRPIGLAVTNIGKIGGVYRDIVLVAKRA